MNDIRLITHNFAEQLIPSFERTNSVYMVVSFAMRTGIELLLPHLRAAVARGADIKILTGDYLYVTEPEALSLLLKLGEGLEARLWRSHGAAFHPKAYLLGIGNVESTLIVGSSNAYRMNFIEAIRKEWLSPFQYFGVCDETDYSKVTWLGTRYDEEELAGAQIRDQAACTVYQAWMRHRQTRTLAFCSSIRQANFLARHFTRNGMRAINLHSHTERVSRQGAIRGLADGQIDVIFTVDLFNEGVDIPSVDTLLFVRPTESLTVFTQQIGRGLRLHHDKSHCHIIDLIGNYRNADIKLRVFDEKASWTSTGFADKLVIPAVPENCVLHLDTRVIDLIREMNRKRNPRKQRLMENYRQVRRTFGYRPSYLELHLHGAVDVRTYRQEFGSYVGFLDWADELTDFEKTAFQRYKSWLQEVESTVMTKSYKMVVLYAMLDRGPSQWMFPVRPEDVALFFQRYLMEKEYRKRIDFSDKSSLELWDYDKRGISRLIATMPMTKWAGSSKGLVMFEAGVFRLTFEVVEEDAAILYEWTKWVCEYRLHAYFERRS